MSASQNQYAGYTGEKYPELFDIRAMPKQPDVKKPGQLPEEIIRQFFTKGYIVVENFFTRSELDPIKDTLNYYVDNVANTLYKAGKITNLYADHGYADRLIKLENDFPGANILCFKQMAVVPQALKDIWTNERLLNVIEQLIGPDISGSPVWNIRTKTPRNDATTVPWHQDNSYLDISSYKTLIPTAWIPFVDADEKNGCLQMIEGGHLMGMLAEHQCCYGGTWYTMMEEEFMGKALDVDVKTQIRTLPIKYGSMILFNNLIPHRSLDNVSDHVRWSVDLRWQRTQDPACFYGLKNSVPMRSSTNPDLKVDWTDFDGVNRHHVSMETADENIKEADKPDDPDLDTRIFGPWMKKWELVHMNRHVELFVESEKSQS